MKKFSFLAVLVILTLTACGAHDRHYIQPGKPENLLDNSSERVNFSLNSPSGVSDLVTWVNKDQPTRAEVSCGGNVFECQQAQAALSSFGVATTTVSRPGDGNVALIYDRVMARACDTGYVNNTFNPDNLNHKTFGCATASNQVNMVANKTSFVSPQRLDTQDAEKAVAIFNKYQKGDAGCCKKPCCNKGGKKDCDGGKICSMDVKPAKGPAHSHAHKPKRDWRATPLSQNKLK